MDLLSGMEVFARVVETDSFSAAARRLGMSRAAVSKRVQQLEDHLGARLLNRSTRAIGLTEVGEAYYERCQRVLAEVEEASHIAQRLQSEPRGRLRVAIPMSFGIAYLGAAIADYASSFPGVEVDATLDDRISDLREGGFDLAIRIAQLKDSSLIARKIATTRPVFCASPAYLAAHGAPATPSELTNHRFLGYSLRSGGQEWRLTHRGREHLIRIKPQFRANNGDMLKVAARDGLGIAGLPSFMIADEIRTGALRPVLSDYKHPELSIVAVYPPTRRPSAKVRTFIDYLVERYSPIAPWHLPGIDDA